MNWRLGTEEMKRMMIFTTRNSLGHISTYVKRQLRLLLEPVFIELLPRHLNSRYCNFLSDIFPFVLFYFTFFTIDKEETHFLL